MKLLFLVILAFLISKGISQVSISTIPLWKYNVNNQFTTEWQYLSTDLYLINPNKFAQLINDVIAEEIKKKKKPDFEIQNLLISANLKDVQIFGNELTYPIYNFTVQKDSKSKYNTQITSSSEVIRIIDNLPLSGNNDYIDASIAGEIITNKTTNRFAELLSSQLMNISKITNPTQAVMLLVGEYGKFMDSHNKGRQYQFNSTIRIYESQDFNQRLHSVLVYAFAPSGVEEPKMQTNQLKIALDSIKGSTIDNRFLSTALNYSQYPYIVIVNYKSKYITEPVIGDEINFETISQREQKTKNAFDKGLMNKETFIQEMKLKDFLLIFSQLKLDISNYKVNYKNDIIDDLSKSFFIILQQFRNLKNTYKNRWLEFQNNSQFKNEFKPIYESIISNSELYLEGDNNLKNIKELVNVLYEFDNNANIKTDANKREEYLRRLYSVTLPSTASESNEYKDIQKLILKLESDQFTEVFEKELNFVSTCPVTDENLIKVKELKSKLAKSYCRYCAEKAQEAFNSFNERIETQKLKLVLKKHETLVKSTRDDLFDYLKKENCCLTYFKTHYDTIPMPAHIALLNDDFKQLVSQKTKLFELSQQSPQNKDIRSMEAFIEEIEALNELLKNGYANLCNKIQSLCDCKDN